MIFYYENVRHRGVSKTSLFRVDRSPPHIHNVCDVAFLSGSPHTH